MEPAAKKQAGDPVDRACEALRAVLRQAPATDYAALVKYVLCPISHFLHALPVLPVSCVGDLIGKMFLRAD
eukprot:COSAG02_NODE_5276_length_4478_cov_1.851108_7_plen_71_part_00